MSLLDFDRKKVSSLTQAKIMAVDKILGRVSLYMKNGLVSAGYYLYDINDLRVGMSVLVGLVDGTYVILNKVSNMPRVGTSYTVTKAPTNQMLILNFNGDNGSTTYLEEVSSLVPDDQDLCYTDTSQHKFGSGSLKIEEGGYLSYGNMTFTGDFTLHCYYQHLQSPVGYSWIQPMTWYHFALVRTGSSLIQFRRGTIYQSNYVGLSPITIGITTSILPVYLWGSSQSYVWWIDAIEITRVALWTEAFTPPTQPPVRGVLTREGVE